MDMFTVIGLMFTGMFIGFALRRRELGWIHRVITFLIWLLLFLLGTEVGGNREIINGLHTLGMEAIVLTVAAVLGSVTAAWALWRMAGRPGKEDGR